MNPVGINVSVYVIKEDKLQGIMIWKNETKCSAENLLRKHDIFKTFIT